MNPSVRIKEQPGFHETIISVFCDYDSDFIRYAKSKGGKWRYPFPVSAWQFVVYNYEKEEFRRNLESALSKYYPEVEDKMSSTIETTRTSNTFTQQAVSYSSLPTTPQNGHSSSSESVATAKIAEAVARVVTAQVDRKLQVSTDQVNLRIASSERLINEALLREKATTDAVTKRLDEVLRPVVVHVHRDTTEVIREVGLAHKQFPVLLRLITGLKPHNRNVWIAGPAGSGKTHAARQLAESLGLPYHFNGAIDSPYKLSGFIDAQSRIVSTAFRRAVEEGGVYLFDEVDASMPSALMAFQAFLANGHADFPDRISIRHPDCYVLAAGNTWGHGGDANYVGRAKLDAAFLNRFVSLRWDYDEVLERNLAQNDEWVEVVLKVRRKMRERGAQMVISPRASINGAQLLSSGLSREETVEAVFGLYRSHSLWSEVGRAAEEYARAS